MLISELKEKFHFIDLSRKDRNKVFLNEEISMLVSNLFSLQEDRELNEVELNSIKLGLMSLDLTENRQHKKEILFALHAVLNAIKDTVSYQREQFAMESRSEELLELVYVKHLTAMQYREIRFISGLGYKLVINVPQLIRFLNEKPPADFTQFVIMSDRLRKEFVMFFHDIGLHNYEREKAFLKVMQFLLDNINQVNPEIFLSVLTKLQNLVNFESSNKIFSCSFDRISNPLSFEEALELDDFFPQMHPCILIFNELFNYIKETVKTSDLGDLDRINQLNFKELFSLCIKLKIKLNETNIGKIIEAAIGDEALFLSLLREKDSCDQAQFDDLIEALRQDRFIDVCNNDTQAIYQLPVDIINTDVLPYVTSESSRYNSLIRSHKARIAVTNAASSSSSSAISNSSSSSSASSLPSNNNEDNDNNNNSSSVVQALLRSSSSLFSTSSPSGSGVVGDTSRPSASSSSAPSPFQK